MATDRSACAETAVVVEAVLFAMFRSTVGDATVADPLIVLPSGAAADTAKIAVIVLEAPLASGPLRVQTTGLPAQLPPEDTVPDTKVVLAGTGSVTVGFWAASGPALLTTAV
jgi:hypothetical protein